MPILAFKRKINHAIRVEYGKAGKQRDYVQVNESHKS